MPVTDEQVSTLRALLAGDFDTYDRKIDDVAADSSGVGYSALVVAGFFEAVDRRFTKDSTSADVIEFVGDVRSRSERLGREIDPTIAERLIRHALGDGSITDIDDKTRGGSYIVLLAGLIADERLDAEGLDAFIAEVRPVAEEWTAEA